MFVFGPEPEVGALEDGAALGDRALLKLACIAIGPETLFVFFDFRSTLAGGIEQLTLLPNEFLLGDREDV
jgi:hypothetical protein